MNRNERIKRVVQLAELVASSAPERRHASSYQCYIPWHLIEELRAELSELATELQGVSS